jgi:hypothetical protein
MRPMPPDQRRYGRFALPLAVVVLGLLAAGCGGGNGGSSGGGSSGDKGAGPSAAFLAKAEELGSEASGSRAGQAEAALRGYLDARAGEEWTKACSFLTKGFRQLYSRLSKSPAVKGKGCAGTVAKVDERLSPRERADLRKFEVDSVRVEGGRGYIIYTDAAGTQRATPIASEGGRWKISSPFASFASRKR